jgi:hypothetical protein
VLRERGQPAEASGLAVHAGVRRANAQPTNMEVRRARSPLLLRARKSIILTQFCPITGKLDEQHSMRCHRGVHVVPLLLQTQVRLMSDNSH